jgi:hypothetical protein
MHVSLCSPTELYDWDFLSPLLIESLKIVKRVKLEIIPYKLLGDCDLYLGPEAALTNFPLGIASIVSLEQCWIFVLIALHFSFWSFHELLEIWITCLHSSSQGLLPLLSLWWNVTWLPNFHKSVLYFHLITSKNILLDICWYIFIHILDQSMLIWYITYF